MDDRLWVYENRFGETYLCRVVCRVVCRDSFGVEVQPLSDDAKFIVNSDRLRPATGVEIMGEAVRET